MELQAALLLLGGLGLLTLGLLVAFVVLRKAIKVTKTCLLIALLGVGGALVGRALDSRYDTGIRFTLMLLFMGVVLGSVSAYRSLRKDG